MKKQVILTIFFFLFSLSFYGCKAQKGEEKITEPSIETNKVLRCGAEVLLDDLSLLKNKKVALVVNPTSMVADQHIVDRLLGEGILIQNIFAPEHGFRGTADAGEKVNDGIDSKTGVKVISLYGKHKKPTKEDLLGVELVVFDIQDVGARFYTYISTLHYVMEACAEQGISLLVLDRPNPNGFVVDGNVLNMKFSSFVGMHPIPIMHGMTIGEYAQMINGEKWLSQGLKCDLEVIACQNYDHTMPYILPVKPSPNLPNARAIELYPSTCFFEGTVISEGRGTLWPFQVFGAPNINPEMTNFSFTPKSMEGAKYPKFENKLCYGFDLSNSSLPFEEQKGINLSYLISMYNLYPDQANFFLETGFFDLLAGGDQLRKDIIAGKSEEEIKLSWQKDLEAFKLVRKKYLLYPDFE